MESCRKILQQGLQTLGITTNENKLELLLAFIQLIEKWNKTYNLTAIGSRNEMANLHMLDSLTALPYLQGNRVADIGTGAGLPGIPLAIFSPDIEFTLIDSNAKKTRFVQQVILELKLKNVIVIHDRVENIRTDRFFSTIITRALANLHKLMLLTKHLMGTQSILLAMKAQRPNQELANIDCPYSVTTLNLPALNLSSVATERCLIRISGAIENG